MRTGLTVAVIAILLIAFGWHCATHSIDFPLYHQAAAKILADRTDLYPAALDDPTQPITGHAFRYAPVLALLFVPLGLLPLPVAAFVLYILKLLAFVYIWRVIGQRLPSSSQGGRLIGYAILICGGYLAEEFRNGNLHFLVVGLLVLAFDTARRHRVVLPAVALAVAILAKVLPVILVGYFLLRGQYRVAVATVGALIVLLIAPAAVFGWDTNVRLTRTFARYSLMKADEQANHSLRGALFRYLTPNDQDDPRNPDWHVATLPPQTVDRVWQGIAAVGAVLLLVACWRESRTEEAGWLSLSLLLVAMLLGSPHSQRIYYSSLFVPVTVALHVIARHRPNQTMRLLIASLVTMGAVGTLAPLLLPSRRVAVGFEALSPHVAAATLFGIALLLTAHRFASTDRADVSRAQASPIA